MNVHIANTLSLQNIWLTLVSFENAGVVSPENINSLVCLTAYSTAVSWISSSYTKTYILLDN